MTRSTQINFCVAVALGRIHKSVQRTDRLVDDFPDSICQIAPRPHLLNCFLLILHKIYSHCSAEKTTDYFKMTLKRKSLEKCPSIDPLFASHKLSVVSSQWEEARQTFFWTDGEGIGQPDWMVVFFEFACWQRQHFAGWVGQFSCRLGFTTTAELGIC